jgi:hypothetical protein
MLVNDLFQRRRRDSGTARYFQAGDGAVWV